MVATGMGVAITTPLCLLQGIAHASNVDVLPMPGPGFSRELLLATRRGDLATLAPRIAKPAGATIAAHALPRIQTLVPWFPIQPASPPTATDP